MQRHLAPRGQLALHLFDQRHDLLFDDASPQRLSGIDPETQRRFAAKVLHNSFDHVAQVRWDAWRYREFARRWKETSLRGSLFAWLGTVLLVQTLAGCSSIGPRHLENDQLDYSRTVSDVGKRQTLFNLIRLRYADTPMFASVEQMVAGYTLQGSVQAGLQGSLGPVFSSSFGTGQGSVQYTDRPTFTFAPLSGERFVEAYLRPLLPISCR
jgi:hypothetical protein